MTRAIAVRLAACACSLALGGACTTSETGSIDLAVASASKPTKAAMMPPMQTAPAMPKEMPSCMDDMDCPKPTPRCDMDTGKCVKCTEDAGCPPEPMSPPKPPPP